MLTIRNNSRSVFRFPLDKGDHLVLGDINDAKLAKHDSKFCPSPEVEVPKSTLDRMAKPVRKAFDALVADRTIDMRAA